jgi:hypothetical protein
MPIPILSLFLIAGALLGEIRAASAQSPTSYPWCAKYSTDAPVSCYFISLGQCKKTLSGVGGHCFENPYVHVVPPNAPRNAAASPQELDARATCQRLAEASASSPDHLITDAYADQCMIARGYRSEIKPAGNP